MKRVFSMLLALAILVGFAPTIGQPVLAAETNENGIIQTETVYAQPGGTVTVDITVKNNPGILGMTLEVTYDESKVALVSAVNGEAFSCMTFTAPKDLSSGCTLPWAAEAITEEDIKNGVIATLTFKVKEDATTNEAVEIGISYEDGAIIDNDLVPLYPEVACGTIMVIDYKPGDLNGDSFVNTTDVVYLMRYIAGGYNVTINESAADVNDDGKRNTTDVVYIMRYIAGGYGIKLKPSTPRCTHTNMQATAAKTATCTEDGNIAYWYCAKCNKYFSNAAGTAEIALADTKVSAAHVLTYKAASAATSENEGWVEHWHCSVCTKYFGDATGTVELTEEQVLIPKLVKTESSVIYNVYGSDSYLKKVGVDNTKNPSVFYSEEGLVLNDLVAPEGYIFKGWTTASGEPISKIAPDTASRQIVLNATWEKVVYRIDFDTPDVPVTGKKITGEAVTNYTEYTVDAGVTFDNAEWFGYTFVGWSNDEGFLVKGIEPGTTGNMTLHANWTSNRNKATSYTDYGEPIAIIEDDQAGQFLFVYSIGKIDNVPLNQVEMIGNSQGITIDKTYQVTNTITTTEAKNIAEMISKATTESSGWTLSEEWEEIFSAGSETDESRGKTQERTDSEGNTVGGNYYVSNSLGGASFVSTDSGGTTSNSAKVTKEKSTGIQSSYKTSTETDSSVQLGITNETEVSAGIKYGPVSVGAKNTTTISMETNNSRNDKESFELDTQKANAIGTVDESHISSYYDVSTQKTSNWNSEQGYASSAQSSKNSAVANTIAEQITEKTALNVSQSAGAQLANSNLSTDTSGKTNEYSTTFGYSQGSGTTETMSVKLESDRPGYYRLVNAGTVHVFGVVGYDVATDSYFAYTYSLLDDERHLYMDYSKADPNFKDCENAVVPFEVPYAPHEYIRAITARSEGLQVNLDGYITGYTGTDTTVVIPQYWQVDNGDGTFSAIKIRGIADNYVNFAGETVSPFAGNTNIEKIILPVYVKQIPDSAFEGCTSLETVFAAGVTGIGKDAFKGCTNLATFTLDEYVTTLGENAFEGVEQLVVMAANAQVAEAVTNSGAKRITLNLSLMEDSLQGKTLAVDQSADYFALIANGGNMENLQVVSDAAETYISNITFVQNQDTPLRISSEVVTLNRVIVQDAYGFAMILSGENTELTLYGDITLSAKGDNALLCRNVSLKMQNQSIASRLTVFGEVMVYGDITGTSYLMCQKLTKIDKETYDRYMNGHVAQTVKGYAATCTEEGLTDGAVCTICGAWMIVQEVIPAAGHTDEVVERKEPTCTETGLTAGLQCSVCGVFTEPQKEIPATGHSAVAVTGKAPTCLETGLTDGTQCSVCHAWTVAQQEIPALGHTETVVKGYAATCTLKGLTDGARCSVCDTWTIKQQEIPATGHTEEIIKGYAATCTQNGLADGICCSVCKVTIKDRQTINMTGHSFSDWEVDVPATCGVDGQEIRRCSSCLATETRTIAKTGNHNYNMCVCAVCGAEDLGVGKITYTKSSDATYYIAKVNANGSVIRVPAYYQGKPVRVIASIYSYNITVDEIYIPDTVVWIDEVRCMSGIGAVYVNTTGWKVCNSMSGAVKEDAPTYDPVLFAARIENASFEDFRRVEEYNQLIK